MKFPSLFRKPKLKLFELKFVFPPKHCPTCGLETNRDKRHLKVLAVNGKDAFLMRMYLMNEGFEV